MYVTHPYDLKGMQKYDYVDFLSVILAIPIFYKKKKISSLDTQDIFYLFIL